MAVRVFGPRWKEGDKPKRFKLKTTVTEPTFEQIEAALDVALGEE
jgi:hypothetical protein